MFDDSFFDDIESIQPANLCAECRYEVVITLYTEVKPITYIRNIFDLERFTKQDFIKAVTNKIITQVLNFGGITEDYCKMISDYEVKGKRTVFISLSPFSSVKTKVPYSLFINVVKIQKEDCVVDLPNLRERIFTNYISIKL